MFQNFRERLQDILLIDASSVSTWKRPFLKSFQIFYASARDLADGNLSLQAMSLVYTTLITLVPLLAISFSVLKGFGVHNQIEPFLMNILEGLGPEKSAEVTGQVIGFVDNIRVGVLGALGLGLLIYAVIALMQKIEAALNYIWRVGQDRTLSQRFSDYLSVLLMGPLLIFISAGITTTVRHSSVFQMAEAHATLGSFFDLFAVFIPWVVMSVGFTFIYVYMPNTKVKISAAFGGALVAALLWKAMGYGFASFIAGSANYVAIYAAFATLIVLMIWLYASWLVVLMGANVAFYIQYPRYLQVRRETLVLSPHTRTLLGLAVLSAIAKSHYQDQKPWTLDGLSKHLNVPILAIQQVVNVLESGGILKSSSDDPVEYFPAKPFGTTPLQVAIDALEKQGQQGWLQIGRMNLGSETRKIMDTMRQAQEKAITHKSISEALLGKKS